MSSVSLPDSSFLALRELRFQNPNVLEVKSFWEINELIGRLTTLECIFYPINDEDEG